MKKLILVSLLILFAISATAQQYSSFNQEQLNRELQKAKNKFGTGGAFTFIGVVTEIVGTVVYFSGSSAATKNGDVSFSLTDEELKGMIIMCAGEVVRDVGIALWITGGIKKRRIEFQLAKFKSPGSASINGIGLKIWF
jgi:hypothetical protein